MRRWGSIVVLTLCLAATAVASPMGAGTVVMKPNAPGAGSHLGVDAGGNDAGFRKGQIPVGFAIAFQKGFVLDTTAVAGTCTTGQATKDQCPTNSVLGSGDIDVSLNGGVYHAQITFFRSTNADGVIFYFKEPQSGFNGASEGKVEPTDQAPYGTVLAFDKLPLPDLPPGLDIQLNHLKLDLGAGSAAPAKATTAKPKPKHHKKKKRHYYCTKHRGHGKHRHCVKWSTHRPKHHRHRAHASAATSFIVNPPDCSTGSWTVQLRWTYKDGTQELREGAAPCAGTGQTPSP